MEISKIIKTLRFCVWLRPLYSWRQDKIVQGFIWTQKDWICLFWKDLVQGWNHWSIFIIGKYFMQILTLIHSSIHKEQMQTKKKWWRNRERGRTNCKNSKKKCRPNSKLQAISSHSNHTNQLLDVPGAHSKQIQAFSRIGS